MQHKSKAVNRDVEDVITIKDESKKRGKRKIGIINELFQGKDDQIWGSQVKTLRNYLTDQYNCCILWSYTVTGT